jgi:polyisoprenoid-binding protein YceI
MDGQLVIDRSQFGVGQGQWKAGDAVKLPVTVTVKLQAVRAR